MSKKKQANIQGNFFHGIPSEKHTHVGTPYSFDVISISAVHAAQGKHLYVVLTVFFSGTIEDVLELPELSGILPR